jgi:hypothetical protein
LASGLFPSVLVEFGSFYFQLSEPALALEFASWRAADGGEQGSQLKRQCYSDLKRGAVVPSMRSLKGLDCYEASSRSSRAVAARRVEGGQGEDKAEGLEMQLSGRKDKDQIRVWLWQNRRQRKATAAQGGQ